MLLQGLLAALALPPLAFALAGLAGGLLAWRRGWRPGALVAALAAAGQLLLATPLCAGLLVASLERDAMRVPPTAPAAPPPGAIVVLGAEVALGEAGPDVGPLTLERLRAGAALHRRTGLPVLVTGGASRPEEPALATLMARSLAADFSVPARWVEPRARDTRDNAAFSAAMLREASVGGAFVVTHAWHMPRAREAFARQGFPTWPAPVRLDWTPDGRRISDWLPRPDHLVRGWYAVREWAGRLVYALRG